MCCKSSESVELTPILRSSGVITKTTLYLLIVASRILKCKNLYKTMSCEESNLSSDPCFNVQLGHHNE